MLKSIHAPIRRVTISTIVAIAMSVGSAPISRSVSAQTIGPIPMNSMAECEAYGRALLQSRKLSWYRCFILPQNGGSSVKSTPRPSGGSNRPQNQSGKSSDKLTPEEITKLRETLGSKFRDIPLERLRDPKVRDLVRDYLEDKRNASTQPSGGSYNPYSKQLDLSNPSIRTTIPYRSTEESRYQPGEANGGNRLPNVTGRLLPDGRIGLIPGQIAKRMRGMDFNNFREFRETFWKLVAKDQYLKQGWKTQDLDSMKQGKAPGAIGAERTGGKSNAVLQLDHSHDLQYGGGLYNLDSIRIVTPRFHQGYGRD